MAACDEGCLEHHMPEQASSATNGAFAAAGAAVMGNGCKAREGGGLFARYLAKLRHFSDQHGAGDRADAGGRAETVSCHTQVFICGYGLLDLRLQLCDLAIQQGSEVSVICARRRLRAKALTAL